MGRRTKPNPDEIYALIIEIAEREGWDPLTIALEMVSQSDCFEAPWALELPPWATKQ